MNLNSEKRKGYLISAEMKKVWAVEMDLLKKLLEVCEKHHLKVFAEGGTLLGAVREHGFIPWDDDIDMSMLREDYDKLQAIARNEFTTPYFFQSGYSDSYPFGYSRLRMDGTSAILHKGIYHNYHQGIFIDIFPLDAMPNDDIERKAFIDKTLREREELKLYCSPWFSFSDIKHNLKTIRLLYCVKRDGFNFYFKKYDDNFRIYSIDKCQEVSLLSWFFDKRYVRRKEWYSDTFYLPFENIIIPVPSSYNEVLKQQFGDYMRPSRVPTMHGGFEVLDADKSYLEYLPHLRKKYKWENWHIRLRRIKNVFYRK